MLRDLPDLTSLSLIGLTDGRSITDAGLEKLGHMSDLTSLSLVDCGDITDAGLSKHLVHTYDRTSLDLMRRTTSADDAGLKYLGNMSSITSLGLGGTAMADEGLKYLGCASEICPTSPPSTCKCAA